MADTAVEFSGWAAKKNWGPETPLEKWSYNPPKLGPNDVTIAIDYCGICGSDLHTILPGEKGGWSTQSREEMDPVIAGHEIVGKVVEVGSQVKDHHVGDIVGVGPQVRSCLECDMCTSNRGNLCSKRTSTYNAKYHDMPGYKLCTQGGYADKIRVHEHWVLPIPKGLDPKVVGPLMCAGVTTYAPLKRFNIGPGKSVGVVGIGGLGHLALQWARAMKADHVVAISHSDKKKDAAQKFGATDYCDSSKPESMDRWKGKLDLVLITSFGNDTEWTPIIDLTKYDGGITCFLAIPSEPLKNIKAITMCQSQRMITGSFIGDPAVTAEMLRFAEEHKIAPQIEVHPMRHVNEVLKMQDDGKARFRYVLDNHA
ncbi:hypothetical protein CXG81DRAFT_26423 [Caulochytrium protostelioides]|uniref:Enoyl reductase (ER) domain-containing protein n=1 Tax=Caulochytrium protostelioides TaxID=1555241 RepID=A0A4P9X6R0_9FUNG|nr:hypothetical protein CXG81DRAFT_26423 [Caulochytrium protostelioides]|eukprot:RKP00884.1 hypothetical protein CXG81DRAFT_26423 [Caulochytrium protostelioides]